MVKKSEDILRMLNYYSEDDIQRLIDQKKSLYRKTYILHKVMAPAANVLLTIDRLKLRSYFDLIIGGSVVKKGKPGTDFFSLHLIFLDI